MDILTKQNEFFQDIGNILAQYHSDHYVEPDKKTGEDQDALNFARYLRASRTCAGLSQRELAEKAGLSESTIFALERGLILSPNISSDTLFVLADALDEDIDDLALMLGRGIPKSPGVLERVRNTWEAAVTDLGSSKAVWVVLSLMFIALMASVLFVGDSRSLLDQGSLFVQASTGLNYLPTQRFDALFNKGFQLSMISLLSLLLVWVAIWMGNIPLPLVSFVRMWRRGLVYATPLLVLCTLVLTGQGVLNLSKDRHSSGTWTVGNSIQALVRGGLWDSGYNVSVASRNHSGHLIVWGSGRQLMPTTPFPLHNNPTTMGNLGFPGTASTELLVAGESISFSSRNSRAANEYIGFSPRLVTTEFSAGKKGGWSSGNSRTADKYGSFRVDWYMNPRTNETDWAGLTSVVKDDSNQEYHAYISGKTLSAITTGHQEWETISRLYANSENTFRWSNYGRANFSYEDVPTWTVAWGDIDGDRKVDLAVGSSGLSIVYPSLYVSYNQLSGAIPLESNILSSMYILNSRDSGMTIRYWYDDSNSWSSIDEITRAQAVAFRVGYPSIWQEYWARKETPWPDILFVIARSVLMMTLFSIIGGVVVREGKIRLALTKRVDVTAFGGTHHTTNR